MEKMKNSILTKAREIIKSKNIAQKKIVLLNNENANQFFKSYKSIYENRFEVKYDKTIFNKQLKTSLLFVCLNKNKPAGIMRIKILNGDDKYLRFFNLENKKAIFLSDLAAAQSRQGIGTCMMNFLFNLAKKLKIPIITVPWNDSAEEFYKKFGFETYYPVDHSLPKVIQIKKY